MAPRQPSLGAGPGGCCRRPVWPGPVIGSGPQWGVSGEKQVGGSVVDPVWLGPLTGSAPQWGVSGEEPGGVQGGGPHVAWAHDRERPPTRRSWGAGGRQHGRPEGRSRRPSAVLGCGSCEGAGVLSA